MYVCICVLNMCVCNVQKNGLAAVAECCLFIWFGWCAYEKKRIYDIDICACMHTYICVQVYVFEPMSSCSKSIPLRISIKRLNHVRESLYVSNMKTNASMRTKRHSDSNTKTMKHQDKWTCLRICSIHTFYVLYIMCWCSFALVISPLAFYRIRTVHTICVQNLELIWATVLKSKRNSFFRGNLSLISMSKCQKYIYYIIYSQNRCGCGCGSLKWY